MIPTTTAPSTATCLNCAAPLVGSFCSECGQRAINPLPSVSEIAHDAAEELLQWDGKVARSFRLLLTRPGLLTTEYLAGRRARYVSPVKLYLLCSALFFFVSAVTPAARARNSAGGKSSGGFLAAISTALLEKPVELRGDVSSGDKQIVDARSRSLARVNSDRKGFEQSVESAVPKAMFVLLPVMAALLALAFRRARMHYPQHLVFTLHIHAFFFLVLGAYQLQAVLPWRRWSGVVLVAAFVANAVYTVIAARRVYQRGRVSTIARVAVFATGYFFLWLTVLSVSIAIIAATY
jgi:hypothetical protein